MTYNLRIVNERPAYFFPLSLGTLAFRDLMGSSPAEVLGTPQPTPPLVVGGGTSYSLTGSDNFKFASRVFYQDSPDVPFTLEAWFKPISVSAPKGIIGHALQNDGLSFDGERISFMTSHGPAGDAIVSFSPSTTTGSFHVVGVHTGSKNELYVNGVLVGSVDLTSEQMYEPYTVISSPGFLHVGHLPGNILIDSVAVYSQALTNQQVANHFSWGRDVPDPRSVISERGGNYHSFEDISASIIFNFTFDNQDEWSTGEVNLVGVSDVISPTFTDEGTTAEGFWQAGFILEAISDIIDGSKIEWDSDGPISIMTSLNDGASWSTAINGREVVGISEGFTSGDQALLVRAVFPANQSVDTNMVLRKLSIKIYDSRATLSDNQEDRATFTGNVALASEPHTPIEQDERSGVNLYRGYVSIPNITTRTIEIWVNLQQSPGIDQSLINIPDGPYLRYATTQWATSQGVVVYVNGEKRAGAAIDIIPGRMTHIIMTLPVSISVPAIIGNENLPMIVALAATYDYVLSEENARGLYNSYLGISKLTFSDLSGLNVKDVNETKIYARPWSLVASG